MGLLLNIFTWWNGPTYGTRYMTWRRGAEVGRDAQGNIYYASKPGLKGPQQRWVIYAGAPEATHVPPEWHMWLHKTVDTTPDERPMKPLVWEKPWQPNMTGTAHAHAPSGSLAVGGHRTRATGDYEAWSPETMASPE